MAARVDTVPGGEVVPSTAPVPHDAMSAADRAHCQRVLSWRARALPEPVDVGEVLQSVGVVAVTECLGELGMELGWVGLHAAGVVATVRRAGHDVGDLADVTALELDELLAARPLLRPPYVLAAAVTGGAFALLPGLGTVVARYGASLPGLAGLLGLAAGTGADTILAAATCTRAVTITGAYYGYDPSGPEERAVALAVLSVSLADGADKHSADGLLRAVLAGRLLARVLDDADHLYRERFLRDRYGDHPALAA